MAAWPHGRKLAATLVGLAMLPAACAQAPVKGAEDPAYGRLAPRAEVLARNTVQEALETARSRTSLSWVYAEDGSKGEITPLRTYRSTTGYFCREYVEIVQVAGDTGTSRQRTACRDDDGLWKPLRS